MMNTIELENYTIAFQEQAYTELNSLINDKAYSSIYILVDSNTQDKCSRFLSEKLRQMLELNGSKLNLEKNLKLF